MVLKISKKFYFKSGRNSSEANLIVLASAGETDKGLIRDYNEDKFSVIQDCSNQNYPVFFYGLYDGHGGSQCSEFLKQNLHEYILNNPDLLIDTKSVLLRSFVKSENSFIEEAKSNNFDRSGSCVNICLIVKDKCFIANLGDSRAVLSSNKGNKIFPLSKDHKPFEQLEMNRIIQAGGYVYQSSNYSSVPAVLGPHRVFPGRLSVSRTIGDIYAKLVQFGGNSNVIIPIPEIKHFQILPEHDFILMCSDGIFDKIDNNAAVACIWESFRENYSLNAEEMCREAAKKLIRLAFDRKSMDNVTVIVIALANLQDN
jgi:protein phosphatase 2C family protein 2/3